VISLALAHRHPSTTVIGLEIQPAMVARARKNVRQNGLGNRIEIIAGDVRAVKTIHEPACCDIVVSNPPYRKSSSGRLSPDREKQIARHEIAGHVDDFLRAAAYLLRAKGRLAFIYSAERSIELLATMRAMRLEPKRLRMVHAFAEAEAALALVEAIKSGRSGVKVLPPLIIYRKGKSDNEYTNEVAAIIAGATP
jgi:tRNA1Val (adenine37-N6)-methyltransferase